MISRLLRGFLTIVYVDHVFDLLQGWRLYNLTRSTNWWAREQHLSKVFLIVITFKGFVDVVHYNKLGILLLFFFSVTIFFLPKGKSSTYATGSVASILTTAWTYQIFITS